MRTSKEIDIMMETLLKKSESDPENEDMWLAYRAILSQRLGQQNPRHHYTGDVDIFKGVANWISDYPIARKSPLYDLESE